MRIKNREQWYLLKKSQILKRALFTLVLTFYISFLRGDLNTKMTFDRFFSIQLQKLLNICYQFLKHFVKCFIYVLCFAILEKPSSCQLSYTNKLCEKHLQRSDALIYDTAQ